MMSDGREKIKSRLNRTVPPTLLQAKQPLPTSAPQPKPPAEKNNLKRK